MIQNKKIIYNINIAALSPSLLEWPEREAKNYDYGIQ
jgi:hypothetical protein